MGRWKQVLGWTLALGGAALLVYYSFRPARVTQPAKVKGLELAVVQRAGPMPRPGLPRLGATASEVLVDQAALPEGPADDRGCTPKAVAAVHWSLPAHAPSGDLLDRPLESALDPLFTALMERGRCGGPHAFDGSIELAIDGRVPYRRVAALVYTAGQARFGRFYFRVRTPGGAGALRVDGPSICSGGSPAPPTPTPAADGGMKALADGGVKAAGKPPRSALLAIIGGGGEAPCVTPLIEVGGTGVTVRPMYSKPTGCSLGFGLAPAPTDGGTPAAGPDWSSRILSGKGGACPSVPRAGGRIDTARLADLLHDLGQHVRVCRHVAIAPAPATPWSEVAAVLAVAGPGHEPSLMGPLGPKAAPPSTCSQAVELDAIQLPQAAGGR